MTPATVTGITTVLVGLGLFTVFFGVAYLLYNLGQSIGRGE